MDRGTENYESPLDEVLEGLPEEQPPADLKDRCIAALDVSTARVVRPTWMQAMRNVAAAAAVLILVAGVAPIFMSVREKSRQTISDSPAREMYGAESAIMTEDFDEPRPEIVTGLGAAASSNHRDLYAREAADEANETPTTYSTYTDAMAEAPGAPEDVEAVSAGRYTSSLPGDDRVMRSVTDGETEPWRDLSGDRQVSYHKEMELEVADVEQAHQRVREIVSKRGGYIASDQVRIQEDDLDSARLTIRLPIDAYEDAIEDLKELGEVVRLVGESVDRTHEYYTRGADVREMADREADLLRKYEAETNAQKKRRLKQQLDALRAQLHASKDLLGRLSEETHWPALDLTLTEGGDGPGGFLSRSLDNSVNALAWVGATAIIWLPAVVIVTLFWRRRTS